MNNEHAVSPVIAISLMVAITIILAAGISVLVLGIVAQVQHANSSTIQNAPDSTGFNNGNVTFTLLQRHVNPGANPVTYTIIDSNQDQYLVLTKQDYDTLGNIGDRYFCNEVTNYNYQPQIDYIILNCTDLTEVNA